MLHVIIGPPCAGKSTYARENAADGDVIVDFDAIAKALGSATEHDAPAEVRECAFAARTAAIEKAMTSGFEAWVIHTNPTPEQMDEYRKAEADVVTLVPDMETCLERAEADGRPERTIEAIRKWYDEHDEKGEPAASDEQEQDEPAEPADPKSREPLYKSFSVKLDGGVDGGTEGGSITGYASTWDREPDSYGDVVAKGAFADSIAAWAERDAYIPLLFGHRMDDPKFNIGRVVEIEEDDTGLKFTAEFDPSSEKAQYVRKLYKEGRIYQFSFAYDILDQGEVTLEDGTTANELRKLDILEISAVQVPANRHAQVTDVKNDAHAVKLTPRIEGLSDNQRREFTKAVAEAAQNALDLGIKAGRRNSKADEDRLRDAKAHIEAAEEIIDALLDGAPTPDADEDGNDAKGGEGEAKPKGREVEEAVFDAYKQALIGAYDNQPY